MLDEGAKPRETEMGNVLGVGLIVFGAISGFAAQLLLVQMEVDLAERQPALKEMFAKTFWRNPYQIMRLYKSEFPKGGRIRQMGFCYALGVVAFFSGIEVLLNTR